MAEHNSPDELAHILWKLEHGFTTVSMDHVATIVKWARSLAAENAELRKLVETVRKD